MQDIYHPSHHRKTLVVPQRAIKTATSSRAPIRRPVLQRPFHMIDGISRPVNPVIGSAQSSPVLIANHLPVEMAEHVHTALRSKPQEPPREPSKGSSSLTPTKKQQHLEAALAKARREIKKERRKTRDLKRFGLVFLAGLLVLATGYVSIDTIITNNNAKAALVNDFKSDTSAPVVTADQHAQAQEGRDETELSTQMLANYKVANDAPRALYINKLKVAARILPMATNKDGSIQAPVNIFDSGWYTGSMKPGQVGAMFIDGHASGPTRLGLFGNLDRLANGDTLQVEKGDGTKLTYKVVHTEIIPLEGLDMNKALLPYGRTVRGLNLMTCTGTWIQSKQTFDHRVVVYTEQI